MITICALFKELKLSLSGPAGIKKLFPDRFLAVSLHISIEIYIRTFHVKGFASSFKTLDLRAFQKSSRKARKMSTPQARCARPTAHHEEKKTCVHTYVLRNFTWYASRFMVRTIARARALRKTLHDPYILDPY